MYNFFGVNILALLGKLDCLSALGKIVDCHIMVWLLEQRETKFTPKGFIGLARVPWVSFPLAR